jgi:hypothetical protein
MYFIFIFIRREIFILGLVFEFKNTFFKFIYFGIFIIAFPDIDHEFFFTLNYLSINYFSPKYHSL